MADTIETVINPRKKMGVWEGLLQLAVSPALRGREKDTYTELGLEDKVEGTPLLERDDLEADLLSSRAPVSLIDKTPKPQIARESWKALIAGSYRKVFLGDGYNPSKDSVVTFKGSDSNSDPGQEATTGGQEIGYHVKAGPHEEVQVHVEARGVVHTGHAIATFFGVPNRFEKLDNDGTLVFNGWTILRNYTGLKRALFEKITVKDKQYAFRIPGLNWGYIGGEYGFWQTLALPIKLGIGLPLKLALTVVKFAVNIVKLVTEFLPTLAVYGSAKVIRNLADTIAETKAQKTAVAINRGPLAKAAIYVGYPLLIAVLGVAHYVGRVALLLGTAFTSPAKLTKDAWDFAHQLQIQNSKGIAYTKATNVLNKTLGVFGAILAVGLTVALWAVALPFGIATLVKYVPQFMAAVNWVLATPFIAPALAYVNGALTVVGGYLSVFLPLINAVAVSAGLQVTAGVLAVGVSLGSIAAVVANIATPIIDAIGNWAAKRPSNSGPYSALTAGRTSKKGDADKPSNPDPALDPVAEPAPRPVAEDDIAGNDAVDYLLANRTPEANEQAYRIAALHHLREKRFVCVNPDEDGWDLKNEPVVAPTATASDIARRLVADSTTYMDEAHQRAFLLEAREFAVTAQTLPNTPANVVPELKEVVGKIEATIAARGRK